MGTAMFALPAKATGATAVAGRHEWDRVRMTIRTLPKELDTRGHRGDTLMRLVRAGRRTAIVGVTLFDLGMIMEALVAVDALDEQAAGQNSDRRNVLARLLGGPDPEVRDYFRGKNTRLRQQVLAAIEAIDGDDDSKVGESR
jgi:hypothetical protein